MRSGRENGYKEVNSIYVDKRTKYPQWRMVHETMRGSRVKTFPMYAKSNCFLTIRPDRQAAAVRGAVSS